MVLLMWMATDGQVGEGPYKPKKDPAMART